MEYRSKIGGGLVAFIVIILGLVAIPTLYYKQWIVTIFLLIIAAFLFYQIINTSYIIHDNTLKIRNGFMPDIKINIDSILLISETYNLLSSPATSIDRLEIKYNQSEIVYISPKNKSQFIEHLLKINPKITLKLRNEGK